MPLLYLKGIKIHILEQWSEELEQKKRSLSKKEKKLR